MHTNYKRLMNKSARMVVASYAQPQLLFSRAEYLKLRETVMADRRDFVSVELKRVAPDKRLFDLGMWIRGQGPLHLRESFNQTATEWIDQYELWFDRYVSPLCTALATAISGVGGLVNLESRQLPGIHAEARADVESFAKLVLLAYANPSAFAQEEVCESTLGRAVAILSGQNVGVELCVKKWTWEEWFAGFLSVELARSPQFSGSRTCDSKVSFRTRADNFEFESIDGCRPFGFPLELEPEWDRCFHTAYEAAAMCWFGFRHDWSARIQAFGKSLCTCGIADGKK